MSTILGSIAPLFAVIFLGFVAGRAGYLGEAGVRGLGAFVFNFAIPPYVFRLMAGTDLAAIGEWGFLGGYLGAQAIVFVASAGLGRLLFGQGQAAMTIQGFGAAFTGILGTTFTQGLGLLQAFASSFLGGFGGLLSQVLSVLSQAAGPALGGLASFAGSALGFLSLDGGGIVRRDVFARVHADEAVAPIDPLFARLDAIADALAQGGGGGAPEVHIHNNLASEGVQAQARVTAEAHGPVQRFMW